MNLLHYFNNQLKFTNYNQIYSNTTNKLFNQITMYLTSRRSNMWCVILLNNKLVYKKSVGMLGFKKKNKRSSRAKQSLAYKSYGCLIKIFRRLRVHKFFLYFSSGKRLINPILIPLVNGMMKLYNQYQRKLKIQRKLLHYQTTIIKLTQKTTAKYQDIFFLPITQKYNLINSVQPTKLNLLSKFTNKQQILEIDKYSGNTYLAVILHTARYIGTIYKRIRKQLYNRKNLRKSTYRLQIRRLYRLNTIMYLLQRLRKLLLANSTLVSTKTIKQFKKIKILNKLKKFVVLILRLKRKYKQLKQKYYKYKNFLLPTTSIQLVNSVPFGKIRNNIRRFAKYSIKPKHTI